MQSIENITYFSFAFRSCFKSCTKLVHPSEQVPCFHNLVILFKQTIKYLKMNSGTSEAKTDKIFFLDTVFLLHTEDVEVFL